MLEQTALALVATRALPLVLSAPEAWFSDDALESMVYL